MISDHTAKAYYLLNHKAVADDKPLSSGGKLPLRPLLAGITNQRKVK